MKFYVGNLIFALLMGSLLFFVKSDKKVIQRKIIIDTDAGADDALAILLALRYEALHPKEFKVLAITCVYGNAHLENVSENVLKTLTVANRSDIPVYAGASEPLIQKYVPSNWFGNDGFGEFVFEDKLIAEVNKSQHAVTALINLVKLYPDEIAVICLGPVTNVALATSLDSNFSNRLQKLYIMGSSVEGVGNVAPNIEFNFSLDPESNFIAMNSNTKRPIILLPWETGVKHFYSRDWRINVFGKSPSKVVDFLNQAEKLSLDKTDFWSVPDMFVIAIYLWPDLITKSLDVYVTPVIDGTARGSVTVDYTNLTGKRINTRIVQTFDTNWVQDILMKYFSHD